MKLIIHQDRQITETEITIRCARMDTRLEQLAGHIRQFGFSLTGYQEDKEFQLPAGEDIFYGFRRWKNLSLSGERGVLLPGDSGLPGGPPFPHFLYQDQQKLSGQHQLPAKCAAAVQPPAGGHLQNGEKLVITRNYIEPLKEKLKGANV